MSFTKEHPPITCESLKELVKALSEAEKTQYTDILRTTKLSNEAFSHCCSWSTDSYTRNCIAENEKFELILLCWEKGQMTPIHDHGGEECWVKVIQGEFSENIYHIDEAGKPKLARSLISQTDDITYMIDFMGVHSLENLSKQRSMSLHLYAKPIRNCNIFDEDSRTFRNKDLFYHTVA